LDADKNCKIDYWEFRKLLDALDSSDWHVYTYIHIYISLAWCHKLL
jgi:hypothetical protein